MNFNKYSAIVFERRGRALYATFNRPEVLNCVNEALDDDLLQLFWDFDLDDESDVLVITGAGRAFSAGGDVAYLRHNRHLPNFQKGIKQSKKILQNMLTCEKPIIARVNGDAMGLGATIALFCDIVIADETARIADPHVAVGLAAGDGGAIMWPQLIGYARAKRYLLSGDRLTGKEAAEIGLIAFAVPAAELDAKVEEWVAKLSGNVASRAIKYTKASINIGLQQILSTMVDAGLAYEMATSQSDDHLSAIDAFEAKSKPVFRGE